MKGKSNPVAKFMNVYNRASTHSTPKDYDRKDNGWFKDWLEEDAPANATGVAVSTDKPIVKKKKKKEKKYLKGNKWSLDAGNNEVGTPDIVKRFKDGTPMQEALEEAVNKAKIRKQLQKIKGITNKQIEIILTLPPAVLTQMITQVAQLVSGDEIYERDYKKERENYLGTPEQKKRNAARKRARRALEKEGRVKPFDGKDVHHKDNNPENNDRSNLRVANRSTNRREPRLREGIDEGKLVADINAIFDAIVKSVKKKMGTEYRTNQERGLRFVNQVAGLVGGKVTDKKQQKGKLFYKTK
tara:strand:+ start:229 stop:1125 length:897 start_codon:yes stop_codon:yes gene_type:complete